MAVPKKSPASKTATPDQSRRAATKTIISSTNKTTLKQIQYRSYQHHILIYHFQDYYVDLHSFRAILCSKKYGYVADLISDDPILSQFVPKGDETPKDCIEVGYMPNVFQNNGSALGFRINGKIEWYCYDRNIQEPLLLKLDIEPREPYGARWLFDLVAYMPKGILTRRVKGSNAEHKAWHDSLLRAKYPNVRVTLTWKAFGEELEVKHARLRRRSGVRREEDDAILDRIKDAEEDMDNREIEELETGEEIAGITTAIDKETSSREIYEEEPALDEGGTMDIAAIQRRHSTGSEVRDRPPVHS